MSRMQKEMPQLAAALKNYDSRDAFTCNARERMLNKLLYQALTDINKSAGKPGLRHNVLLFELARISAAFALSVLHEPRLLEIPSPEPLERRVGRSPHLVKPKSGVGSAGGVVTGLLDQIPAFRLGIPH